jgi:hypothetical protein
MSDDDKLSLNVYAEDGIVVMEAETNESAILLPLDPNVAESLAVQLMIAVEEARGKRRGN